MTIDGFLESLSDVEFDNKFLELARSDSFSAIASGVGTCTDSTEVRNAMIALELPSVFYEDDLSICVTVGIIANRIIKKKDSH